MYVHSYYLLGGSGGGGQGDGGGAGGGTQGSSEWWQYPHGARSSAGSLFGERDDGGRQGVGEGFARLTQLDESHGLHTESKAFSVKCQNARNVIF